MKHLGDITKINGAEIEPVDVITGGSPCQDLSCAGKRSGMSKVCPNCGWSAVGNAEESVCPECGTELEYTRSGLFMEQIRVMKEMREHDRRTGRSGIDVRCRYGIWENVPGALSSNKGADFQAVLTEFARVSVPNAPPVPMPDGGKWPKSGVFYDSMGRFSIAYRIHDAQYWGVPQRRRRLALVADFNGLSAAEILFDPQLRRETASTEPDEAESDSGAQPRSEVQPLSSCLPGRSESGGETGQGASTSTAVGTGSASGASGLEPVPIEGNGQRESHRGNGYGNEGDPMFTLNSTEHLDTTQVTSPYNGNNPHYGDPCHPLAAGAHPPSVAYCPEIAHTLSARHDGSPQPDKGNGAEVVAVGVDTYNHAVTGDVACALTAVGAGDPTKSGPSILTAGFKAGQSKDGGLGYEEEKAPTLSATPSALEPTVVCLNDQGGSVMGVSEEVTGALRAQEHGHQPLIASAGFSFGQSAKARSIGFQEEVSPTLRGGEGGNQKPCVLDATAISGDISGTLDASYYKGCGERQGVEREVVVTMNPRPQSMVCTEDMAATLGADDYKEPQMVFDARGNGDGKTVCTLTGDHQNRVTDYTALVTEPEQSLMTMQAIGEYKETGAASALKQRDYKDATDLVVSGTFQNTGQGWWNESDVGATVRTPCGGDSTKANLVAAVDCRNATENPDINGTLQAKEQGQNLNSNNVVRTAIPTSVVRRLTPLECTRLQGLPDGWVEIGEWTDSKGKARKESDSPKYKALGNSLALPFWAWLARRICAQYESKVTMGSLFSGVGAFELAFLKSGAKPVFASEVDDYPIAVCKKHFGDEDEGIEGDVWQYLANQ